MIPPSPRNGTADPQRPAALRRSTVVLAAVVVVGVMPFVARAIDGGPVEASEVPTVTDGGPEWPIEPPQARAVPDLGTDLAEAATTVEVRAVPEPEPEPAPESAIDVAIRVLVDTYAWDERGQRVEELQRVLGVAVDGWYGQSTLSTHRRALESAGLPTDRLPVAPGPTAAQWAALRRCESGGDYAITNPSGKYRGAYKFDRRTWNSVAERHAPRLVGVDPAAASPADQDAMAFALYGERGARPWPNCGRHLR